VEFDNYSSHLFVLEKLFSSFDISRVLEFGLGRYSTAFFVEHCDSVTSVEQESREWYEKMKAEINSSRWRHIFEADPRAVFERFDAGNENFELVLSDGAARTRVLAANLAMERNVPWLVLHDTEKVWYYRWDQLKIPASYSRFNFCHRKGAKKVTTVLANEHSDILEGWEIPEHERVLQAYSSPSQPVFQLNYESLLANIRGKK